MMPQPIEERLALAARHITISLVIIFVVLKITGMITWNWILVLSPAWIMVLLYNIIYIIAAILDLFL